MNVTLRGIDSKKTMRQKYDDFTEAFIAFLIQNCYVYTEGWDPNIFADCEIKVKLNGNGSGYIHLIGQDSSTIDFMTMDHFRSQDMITPTQREEIAKLTQAKATSKVSKANKELRAKVKQLELQISEIKKHV